MNKIFYLLFLIYASIVYSQHLKVEYEQYDNTNVENTQLSKEFNEKVKELRKKPEKYLLYYANGYAFFKSNPRQTFMHNAGDLKDGDTSIHNREIYIENELKLYRSKNDNGTYNYHSFPNLKEEFYGYKDSKFSKIEYKDQTIMIDKYICKLVEVSSDGVNNYKVWYTEDIPVSAGPFKFNNFPGLVLRVESPNYIITAVKISNDVKDSELEKVNPKLKVYRNDEYAKKLKEAIEQSSKPTFEKIDGWQTNK